MQPPDREIEYKRGKQTSISIPPVAMTKMTCPDMETENNILSALSSVKTFGRLDGKRIAFITSGGVEVLVITKK